MEQHTLTLTQLVTVSLEHLRQKNYSKLTIIRHRCTWNHLIKYAESYGIRYYTLSHGIEFITQHYGVDQTRKISYFHCHLIRSMTILYEIQEFGYIKSRAKLRPSRQPVYFLKILEDYSESLVEHNLSYKTVRQKKDKICKLLLFLEEKGLRELFNLTAEKIYDYLKTQKSLAITTREVQLYVIRDFIRFLVSQQKCKQELAQLFPVISVHSKDSIPSFFAADAIKKVLDCIDRNTMVGKRDYAVLLLAVQLGIRAGDIRNLKMEHIKWTDRCIEFIQKKTGNFISLPLPHETLLSLLDYLKNSRPQSESSFVFLKSQAPYNEYGDQNAFYYVVKKYLKAAKVEYKSSKHHGLHSMRHSLAGNMLLDGTPMPIITNILGHRYADTTSKYLKIDIAQLRQVALEVPYDSKG